MRALVVFVVVVLILAIAGILVGDAVAVHATETTIQNRIEARVPGSSADVNITSQPYLVKLAASGTVDHLHAHVTNVAEPAVTFHTVDVDVHGIQVNRGDLFSGQVHLDRISTATVTATLTPNELLPLIGASALRELQAVPSGTTATVQASSGGIEVAVRSVGFRIPFDPLVSCAGSATYAGGNVTLSCTTDTLPPALSQQVSASAVGAAGG